MKKLLFLVGLFAVASVTPLIGAAKAAPADSLTKRAENACINHGGVDEIVGRIAICMDGSSFRI